MSPVKINASALVELVGASADISFRSAISSETQGSGDAGNLTINTRNLSVRGGGTVSTGTFSPVNGEQGGSLTVNNASFTETNGARAAGLDSLLVSNQLFRLQQPGTALITNTFPTIGAEGANAQFSTNSAFSLSILAAVAGLIDFRVLLENLPNNSPMDSIGVNSSTNTIVPIKGGKGGTLIVNASDSVELVGTTQPSPLEGEIRSSLNSVVGQDAQGQGGNLIINAQRLSVRDGAGVSVGTLGKGNAGKLSISTADTLEVSGYSALGLPSEVSASVDATATGQGGDLIIETGVLTVNNRGAITVSSQGVGQGGDLSITARSIELDNQGKLIAETASGQGGNITLNIRDLLVLRGGSAISASAGIASSGGDGGNITVNVPKGFIVGVKTENSNITANAFTGSGGRVNITAQGIYGLQFRPKLTEFSDITASSTFGVSGVVAINTLGIDPSKGLVQLPATLADASNRIAQRCPQRDSNQEPSTFYITGRGGLPLRPGDLPLSEYPTGEVRNVPATNGATDLKTDATDKRLSPSVSSASNPLPTASVAHPLPDGPIVEANAIARDANGNLWLVAAQAPPDQIVIPWLPTARCQDGGRN